MQVSLLFSEFGDETAGAIVACLEPTCSEEEDAVVTQPLNPHEKQIAEILKFDRLRARRLRIRSVAHLLVWAEGISERLEMSYAGKRAVQELMDCIRSKRPWVLF